MPRRLPSLNALRAFEATARNGSLSGAANELKVTPSAVGHQVKGLESWFDTVLFTGIGRERRLTPHGERLADDLAAAFDQIDRACQAIQQHTRTTELRLSVTPTFAIRWLVPRLPRFQAQHPDVAVHIAIGFDARDLQRDGVDAALRFGCPPWPELVADLLFPEDVFPVCHPRLLEGAHPPSEPHALAHHTLLHTAHRRDDWARWLAAAGVDAGAVDASLGPVFDLTTMALDAAEAGMGIAITREAQVSDALEAGRLVAPLRRDLLRGEGCYFLTAPERRDEPHIGALREWLVDEAAQRPLTPEPGS